MIIRLILPPNYGYIITIITPSLAVVILTFLLITGMKRTVRYRSYGEQAELDLESLGEANRETVNALMHISEISEIIESIKTIIKNDKLASDAKVQGINTLLKQLNMQQNYREMFNQYFAKMNAPFLRKLNWLHPGLSQRDERLCILIISGLSTKEIASLLGTAPRAVETAKYRLRKKLRLTNDMITNEYLQNILNSVL